MKRFSILLLALVAVIGLSSCTHDDDVVFVAQPDPEGVNFTNSTASSYILAAATSSNVAERFVWNEVDFDAPTTVTYELQASASKGFNDLSVIGETSGNNLEVTVSDLMGLAADAGLDNDPETDDPNMGQVYFRVHAYAGDGAGNALEHTSEVMPITVVLPEAEEEGEAALPMIYVVGNFQAAGGYGSDWTPADGAPLAAEGAGETEYAGFVYINADAPEFKFLPTNEGWDGDYGDTGEKNGAFNGTIEQEDEVNAGTPDGTGGYYLVEVDTDALTYDLTETNWGVIGNATPTGWDADTDMTYDAESKTWSVTLDLTAQEAPDNGIKFRANDAWDLNLGDTGADGTMEFGGENIGVPESGNYTITLDLSNPRQYTYTLTKN
ncbi:SusE domain-containing protein [Salegentibacter chungangensis]|uniref:SusE domain-containing protein n=1 Tax=Salegentibacter chungangensis TaxID=1335724 RepID=A0ABW3NTL5_9FLAO